MPSGLYGFRPKRRPQYQATDTVTNPIDPRVPRPLGAPPAPTAPVSDSQPYHSGVSAENDDNSGPGNSINQGGTESNPASYASTTEALNYGKAGFNNGYFGTVQDAAAASAKGNTNAAATLGGFIQNTANNPSSFGPKAPGTLGFLAHALGADENQHGGVTQNVEDAVFGLEASGNLFSPVTQATGSTPASFADGNSSGYQGDTITEQQNLSDIHNATVFGNLTPTTPTLQQLQGPEIFHDAQDTQATQQAEQQANYDHYQDNSSDDNHGQTDGTQTGGETSHAGGYGGYADDSASSGGGGGGGGK